MAVESDGAVSLDAMMRRGVRDKPDVSALASRDGNKLYVMLWHYHDDDLAGPAAEVELTLANLPQTSGTAKIEHFTIDAEHSNAYAAWQRMGSPQEPTPEQYAELEQAAQLAAGAADRTGANPAARRPCGCSFHVRRCRCSWCMPRKTGMLTNLGK